MKTEKQTIKDGLNQLFDNIDNDISDNVGWMLAPNVKIEPLRQNLAHWRDLFNVGATTPEQFYHYFEDLFDADFDRFIGWDKPETSDELLNLFVGQLQEESNHQLTCYYVIKNENELIGIVYFYGVQDKYKKAKLGISLISQFRGSNIAEMVIASILERFMSDHPDRSRMTRLCAMIEPENIKSLALFARLSDFECEGLHKNYYGRGDDCYCYAHTISE